ncbi:MRG-domain-containing protein [Polychytrium aggregatum]|uniref:MRG-domain-containing protein n=1 Tax=Polychytrium aggregatum TaxID=110093 RepID=UPI0022FE5086|nr:MRG-domain-containing protein [Polychytrium aggregatum]KAI9197498.1 MRG-domain-containing protein [Polychytrium aggregatum]
MIAMASFQDNEHVLCFHGPLIYDAKILKSEIRDGSEGSSPFYLVHYKGWKQTWDEWVPESRILKNTDENRQRADDLKRTSEKKASTNKKAGTIEKKATHDNGTDRGKKRVRDSLFDKEEDFLRRLEIKIPIPDKLKVQLVDDWEYVTKSQMLVSLPRSQNVVDVLNMYRDEYRKTHEGRMVEINDEVIEGLKIYFDKALGNILLYRFERQQYVDLKKKYSDKPMSELYGPEHLLRLFVQLPQLIAHTNMDQDAVNLLRDQLVDILAWMNKMHGTLFAPAYTQATPGYLMTQKTN